MTLEEYRGAWQEHDEPEVAELDEEELMDRIAERAERFEKKIRRRDLLETLAAVAVVAVFGHQAVTGGPPLARLGAAVVVAGAVLVVWRLHRARRAFGRDGAGRPVADRLRAQRERLDDQIELLESVLWWYVAPLAAGAGLFTVGVAEGVREALLALAVEGGICAVVWYLNHRTVETGLRPRREAITRLVRRFEER